MSLSMTNGHGRAALALGVSLAVAAGALVLYEYLSPANQPKTPRRRSRAGLSSLTPELQIPSSPQTILSDRKIMGDTDTAFQQSLLLDQAKAAKKKREEEQKLQEERAAAEALKLERSRLREVAKALKKSDSLLSDSPRNYVTVKIQLFEGESVIRKFLLTSRLSEVADFVKTQSLPENGNHQIENEFVLRTDFPQIEYRNLSVPLTAVVGDAKRIALVAHPLF
eukprot:TRINITY_DN7528_c0_g1_i1.p1 TRINITY_DN7528_c0_g1~~TRINITY_DN7528_c0_g1_i1.p1  ORF type:complete len:224 (-),score=59.32 TRINITY_DN7528_c0_g1_i1:79-750(-)